MTFTTTDEAQAKEPKRFRATMILPTIAGFILLVVALSTLNRQGAVASVSPEAQSAQIAIRQLQELKAQAKMIEQMDAAIANVEARVQAHKAKHEHMRKQDAYGYGFAEKFAYLRDLRQMTDGYLTLTTARNELAAEYNEESSKFDWQAIAKSADQPKPHYNEHKNLEI